MAAKIENGTEIEIIIRKRKGWQPVGKAGHAYLVRAGDSLSLRERKELADKIAKAAAEALPGCTGPHGT